MSRILLKDKFIPDNFPGADLWEYGEGENDPQKQVDRVVDEFGDKITKSIIEGMDSELIDFVDALLERVGSEGTIDNKQFLEEADEHLCGIVDMINDEMEERLKKGEGWDDGSADWSDYLEKESEEEG